MDHRLCMSIQPEILQLEDHVKWSDGKVNAKHAKFERRAAGLADLITFSAFGFPAPNICMVSASLTITMN